MLSVNIIDVYVRAEFMLVNTGVTCVNNDAVTGGINGVMVKQDTCTVNMDVTRVNLSATYVNNDVAHANIRIRYVSTCIISVNTINTNAVSSPFGVTLTP